VVVTPDAVPTPRLAAASEIDGKTEDDQIYSDEDRAYNQMTDDPRW